MRRHPTVTEYLRFDVKESLQFGDGTLRTDSFAKVRVTSAGKIRLFFLKVDRRNAVISLEVTGVNGEIGRIAIQSTRPTFGGTRYWFICTPCSRRCRSLYTPKGVDDLACRQCSSLTYPTQRMAFARRMRYRALKIERRIGGERADGLFYKPKRMHWRTFNRLLEEAAYYDDCATLYSISRDRSFQAYCRHASGPLRVHQGDVDS